MPADFRIDTTTGVVFSNAWGELTDADLRDHQTRLKSEAGFTPSLNQLFDFRDVTSVEVTSLGIRTLADRNPFGDQSKRAFVVNDGNLAMFGMLRMFQILTDEYPDELRVQYDHIEAARQWLGLD